MLLPAILSSVRKQPCSSTILVTHDDGEEQEVNTTQPFQPGAVSTPYDCGEEIEMQRRQHEKTKLHVPSYDYETPLLRTQSESQSSWHALTRQFPEASATNLEASYSNSSSLHVKMFGVGKKLYNLFTKDKTGK